MRSSEQTSCFSSYEFTLLPSNSVSLTLPNSSSAGRDLDFTISGIESAGRVELFQNSNCSGAAWGTAVNVDGSASSITIENRSIETTGNYQFSARLVTSDGVDTGCSTLLRMMSCQFKFYGQTPQSFLGLVVMQ